MPKICVVDDTLKKLSAREGPLGRKDEKLTKVLDRPKKILHIIFDVAGIEYEVPEKFLELPPESDISIYLETDPNGAKKIEKKLALYSNAVKKGWDSAKTKGKGFHYFKSGRDLEKTVYDMLPNLQPISEDYMDQSVPSMNRIMNVLTFFAKNAKSIKIIPLYETQGVIKALKSLDLHRKQGAEMEASKDLAYEIQKDIDKYRYSYVFMIISMVNKFLPQVLQQYIKPKGWNVDIYVAKSAMSALMGS